MPKKPRSGAGQPPHAPPPEPIPPTPESGPPLAFPPYFRPDLTTTPFSVRWPQKRADHDSFEAAWNRAENTLFDHPRPVAWAKLVQPGSPIPGLVGHLPTAVRTQWLSAWAYDLLANGTIPAFDPHPGVASVEAVVDMVHDLDGRVRLDPGPPQVRFRDAPFPVGCSRRPFDRASPDYYCELPAFGIDEFLGLAAPPPGVPPAAVLLGDPTPADVWRLGQLVCFTSDPDPATGLDGARANLAEKLRYAIPRLSRELSIEPAAIADPGLPLGVLVERAQGWAVHARARLAAVVAQNGHGVTAIAGDVQAVATQSAGGQEVGEVPPAPPVPRGMGSQAKGRMAPKPTLPQKWRRAYESWQEFRERKEAEGRRALVADFVEEYNRGAKLQISAEEFILTVRAYRQGIRRSK